MTDREQVIAELQYMKRDVLEGSDKDKTLDKAIALLKEQEAVKPIRQMESTEWTVCGNCRNHIISKWVFCPHCGREVKWE